MAISSGVFPVFQNTFKIGKSGATSSESDMVTIAELETFSISIDGNNEEWTPMEAEGWVNRMNTGKGFSISMSGKRCIGDEGNDYIAQVAWKTGQGGCSKFEWGFPDGAKLVFDCLINVSNVGGGDSTNVGGLEFEVLSRGKPEYTPAAGA